MKKIWLLINLFSESILQWIFWVGPFIGAAIAAFYHQFILRAGAAKALGSFRSSGHVWDTDALYCSQKDWGKNCLTVDESMWCFGVKSVLYVLFKVLLRTMEMQCKFFFRGTPAPRVILATSETLYLLKLFPSFFCVIENVVLCKN